ncbi:MAG: putative repeat protein (TIGR01451 family) [Spirosomataceae bacterium]
MDTDSDGDPLSIVSINGTALTPGTPQTITVPNGTVTTDAGGVITFTPDANYNGSVTFPYVITDGTATATANEVISVTLVNDAPVAVDDNYTTPEDKPVTDNVLTNDSDSENGPLTVTTTPISLPTKGSVVLKSNGEYTYTPDSGETGEDTFCYEITDDQGLKDTACVTIDIILELKPENNPPVANDDIFIRQPGQVVTGNVVLNDLDSNGLTLTVSTTPVSPPLKGTVTINSNGNFVYTPSTNFDGFDTFIYQVCNNESTVRCSQATVFILEGAVNRETDISVVKTTSQTAVSLNDEVTFSIVVKNNGTINATNIRIKDTLPAGLQYISGAESIVGSDYFWQIAVLAPGASRTLSLKAKVIGRGISINTAVLVSLDQVDTNPDNDSSEVCVSVPIVLCQGEVLEFNSPANFTNVVWFKDGVQFGTGNTISVTESGSYTTKSSNDTCPTNNCCPIVVIIEVCCKVKICIPITVKKVR